jgi:hypothetical protein
LLTNGPQIPHVIYHGLIEPTVDHAQEHIRTHVLPLAEALVLRFVVSASSFSFRTLRWKRLIITHRHGHWFHDKLLSRSLSLLDDHEIQLLEHELLDKLDHVRVSDRVSCGVVPYEPEAYARGDADAEQEEKRSRRRRSGVENAGEAKE